MYYSYSYKTLKSFKQLLSCWSPYSGILRCLYKKYRFNAANSPLWAYIFLLKPVVIFFTVLLTFLFLFLDILKIFFICCQWEFLFNLTNTIADGSDGKESACNVGNPGLIPGSGISPGAENSNSLQYSCQENSMNRGALWATAHGIAKDQLRWGGLIFSLFFHY